MNLKEMMSARDKLRSSKGKSISGFIDKLDDTGEIGYKMRLEQLIHKKEMVLLDFINFKAREDQQENPNLQVLLDLMDLLKEQALFEKEVCLHLHKPVVA